MLVRVSPDVEQAEMQFRLAYAARACHSGVRLIYLAYVKMEAAPCTLHPL